MKRTKRAAKARKKPQAAPSAATAKPAAPANETVSRRDFFSKLGSYAVVTAATGGVGWYFIDEVCATTRENDLTRIGNGIPAVVQIHDPECPRCRALQRETRDAMSNFREDELQYLIANIRLGKGRQLATKHGVGHVTLLLFDGKGNRMGVLAGQNNSDYLAGAFRNLVAGSRRD